LLLRLKNDYYFLKFISTFYITLTDSIKKKDMKILIHNVENYSLQNSFSKIIRKIDENKIKKIK